MVPPIQLLPQLTKLDHGYAPQGKPWTLLCAGAKGARCEHKRLSFLNSVTMQEVSHCCNMLKEGTRNEEGA